MFESLLSFINTNPEWAFFTVFIVAFCESLAVIGLFVPGWLLLVGIGGLIGQEVLDFYSMTIAAFLGAVIGESLSYYLGYHYHQKILAMPVLAKRKKLTDNAHDFFQKHGVFGVFIGRFLGPTRALVPFIAGLSEMPKRTFLWVNVSSAAIWAPLNLMPGILIGAAYQLEKELANAMFMYFLAIALSVIICTFYIKKYSSSSKLNRTNLLKSKVVLSLCILICVNYLFFTNELWQDLKQIIVVLLTII